MTPYYQELASDHHEIEHEREGSVPAARLERAKTAEYLRAMACAAGEPWTGTTPWEDHGHTTCWHLHRAADWLDPR